MSFSDTAEIEMFEPSGETKDLLGELDGSYATDVVEHLWQQFISSDGRGLYDTLVTPITGDFNRIKENGKAWEHVSGQFESFSQNLADNTHTLLSQHWTYGDAADAYQQHIENHWTIGLYIAGKLSEAMGKGFEQLGDWSIALGERAIELINRIIKRLLRLAAKVVPKVGQVVAAIDWVASGFRDFPYVSDVQEIIELVDQVMTIHRRIEELVEAMQDYFDAFEDVIDAISSIPDVDHTHDMIYLADSLTSGLSEMENQRDKAERTADKLDEDLEELDDMVADEVR
ncbi:hypothetical protein [Haloechinothrix sp. LS1_15]|uniref:hypothetical protein n=1 Tax=Haloechinothrix sp. LS1_15 TaxID=2652248 RepID=UPI00294404AA|nr:hypothetical protein [Haloechinothrix sp. LS1_15]MDV6013290.1 hypothetical protein [Haloechinothrix sp. LS1_15]